MTNMLHRYYTYEIRYNSVRQGFIPIVVVMGPPTEDELAQGKSYMNDEGVKMLETNGWAYYTPDCQGVIIDIRHPTVSKHIKPNVLNAVKDYDLAERLGNFVSE